MVMICQQNIGLHNNSLIANKSFEYVAKSKYLETAITEQKCFHVQIKSRLNTAKLTTILLSVFFLHVPSLKSKRLKNKKNYNLNSCFVRL